MTNLILNEALRLQSLGASVIPIGKNKKPALPKWKPYQTAAADKHQIHDWLDGRHDLGLGLILGTVSGDLIVRDFDNELAWKQWKAEYSHLAKSLPYVVTSRGRRHIYARIFGCPSLKFEDGELRSSGNYVVAPPSIHPSGRPYRWGRGFQSLSDVPLLSIEQSGFSRCWLTPTGDCMDTTDRTEVDSVRSVPICGIQSLIQRTTPKAYGSRRKQLFNLARLIRIDSELKDVPIHELKSLVRQWHKEALPNIRSKCFDETWADFVEAYGNVNLSRCHDTVVQAMEKADTSELPQCALQYENPLIRRLVALCAELARTAPDGVFYLSCRKAADVLGTLDFKSINRQLNMLLADRILHLVEQGGPHSNKSSRYGYLPGNFDPIQS